MFQMVILDVLIIGGGPHALTLASLLSSPDPDPHSNPGHDSSLSPTCSDPLSSQPNLGTPNNRCSSGKKKRRAAAGTVCLIYNNNNNSLDLYSTFKETRRHLLKHNLDLDINVVSQNLA